MAISSIDELLMGGGGNSQQPDTPEYQDEPEEIKEIEPEDTPDYGDDAEPDEPSDEPSDDATDDDDEPSESEQKPKKKDVELDEYGNEKENEAIRDRLARQARKHEAEINALRAQLAQQGASQQVQQAAQDFEYDPEAQGDWKQQLASFVKQTVQSMTRDQQETQKRAEDAKAQAEFETKFREGMNNFGDFSDVITALPFEITDPMTLATRAMENPAAFLYAAAKRNPQELERISKIRDPYVQMTEMGKLEERMRRNKPTTKAPRPLGRAPEDATVKSKPKVKDTSGDDLLAKADAKRLNTVKTRIRNNR